MAGHESLPTTTWPTFGPLPTRRAPLLPLKEIASRTGRVPRGPDTEGVMAPWQISHSGVSVTGPPQSRVERCSATSRDRGHPRHPKTRLSDDHPEPAPVPRKSHEAGPFLLPRMGGGLPTPWGQGRTSAHIATTSRAETTIGRPLGASPSIHGGGEPRRISPENPCGFSTKAGTLGKEPTDTGRVFARSQ